MPSTLAIRARHFSKIPNELIILNFFLRALSPAVYLIALASVAVAIGRAGFALGFVLGSDLLLRHPRSCNFFTQQTDVGRFNSLLVPRHNWSATSNFGVSIFDIAQLVLASRF